jgi:dihydropteroate synthase
LNRSFGGLLLDRPQVMAIVNVTPDSFSDGGQRFDAGRAVDDGLRFVAEGADIVDVGGESTRPGAQATPADEELKRILRVVEELARQGVVVSVDTRRAMVARACLEAGARIVNDVSALRDDEAMLPLLARSRAAVVLMHRRGEAVSRYEGRDYRDVVEDVRDFLVARAALAEAAGVAHDTIAIDPGIGFGKTPRENLALIEGAGRLAASGYPVLIGSSRKGFIGRLTGVEDAGRRDPASIWLAVEAARQGASVLRVHDVAGTRQALAVWLAMR